MITEADTDGDGEISLEEFEKVMTTLLYTHNKTQQAQKLMSQGQGGSKSIISRTAKK